MRTTEFAPALLPVQVEAADFPSSSLGYGPAEQALPWKRSRFSGRDFIPQPDGTLRCPAGQLLFAQERLARNARAPTAGQVTIKLFGVPEAFATFLGLPTA